MEGLLEADGTPGGLLLGRHKVVRFFLIVWTKSSLWIEDANLAKMMCISLEGFGGGCFLSLDFFKTADILICLCSWLDIPVSLGEAA